MLCWHLDNVCRRLILWWSTITQWQSHSTHWLGHSDVELNISHFHIWLDYIKRNLHNLFLLQIKSVQFVKDQLCFSGLSPEVQSERAGAERKQPQGVRSEAAVWASPGCGLAILRSVEGWSLVMLVSAVLYLKHLATKHRWTSPCFPQWSCERRMTTTYALSINLYHSSKISMTAACKSLAHNLKIRYIVTSQIAKVCVMCLFSSYTAWNYGTWAVQSCLPGLC